MSDLGLHPLLEGAIPNSQWITDEEEVADPSPLPIVTGLNILVRPVPIREKSKGGILLPDVVRDDAAYLNTVGRVLSVGPLAYSHDDFVKPGSKQPVLDEEHCTYVVPFGIREPWCKIGDYVVYGKNIGRKFFYKSVKLLLIEDRDVLMVVTDPEWLNPNLKT